MEKGFSGYVLTIACAEHWTWYSEGKCRDGFLSVNVWDIGVGTGTRPRLIYELIVPDEHSPCRANAWVLRRFIPDTKTNSWRKGAGAGLFRALKNYVGAVDHASSLNLFDPSIIHPLAHEMERFEQQFGLRECTTRPPNPMSFDLATHTIVSPSSVMVMTLEGFLTKATVLWQWWQRIDSHSLLASDNSDAMTFVQIRYVPSCVLVSIKLMVPGKWTPATTPFWSTFGG